MKSKTVKPRNSIFTHLAEIRWNNFEISGIARFASHKLVFGRIPRPPSLPLTSSFKTPLKQWSSSFDVKRISTESWCADQCLGWAPRGCVSNRLPGDAEICTHRPRTEDRDFRQFWCVIMSFCRDVFRWLFLQWLLKSTCVLHWILSFILPSSFSPLICDLLGFSSTLMISQRVKL